MDLGVIVGWIVVVGFAATLVITLLALIKKLAMEDKYLGRLFVLLVLEMIASAFFLFQQEYAAPKITFEPNPATRPLHLCDSDGKPIAETTLKCGEEEFAFEALDLKDKRRGFDIEGDVVYIKHKEDGVFLGSLSYSEIKDEVNLDPLTVKQHLHLGLYQARCTEEEEIKTKDGKKVTICVKREDKDKAAENLYAALRGSGELDDDDKEKAVTALYKVRKGLDECEKYKSLALWNQDLKPRRQIEVADIYLDLSEEQGLDRNVKKGARRAALTHYQEYCDSSAAPDKETACTRAKELRAELGESSLINQEEFECKSS